MPNPTIRFSHIYSKMLDVHCRACTEATLLQVLPVNLNMLSKEFIDYDTSIFGGGNYKLPSSGEYLLLIFNSHDQGLFTTLRPAYGKEGKGHKHLYYDMMVGKKFNVMVEPTPLKAKKNWLK